MFPEIALLDDRYDGNVDLVKLCQSVSKMWPTGLTSKMCAVAAPDIIQILAVI